MRFVLFAASAVVGAIVGNPFPILQVFFATFSSEQYVVPICTAMGFAYVVKDAECDKHLVRLLIAPIRKVRFLLIPGVIVVGCVVNVPLISQTSAAVCLAAVAIPLLRAAGYSPSVVGGAIVLGASIGGELLNPAAPELISISKHAGMASSELPRRVAPLLAVMLVVSCLVYWFRVRGQRDTETIALQSPEALPLRPISALIPLIPLLLLCCAGPPFRFFDVPAEWFLPDPKPNDPRFPVRLIGAAMLLGTCVVAITRGRKAPHTASVFFEGAGVGFTKVVSVIVAARCFATALDHAGLAPLLGAFIENHPEGMVPLAGTIPAGFAFLSGSGMASTESLYKFFHTPAVNLGEDPGDVGAFIAVASAAGRTTSPAAAVIITLAALVGVRPIDLVKRIAPSTAIALAVVIALRVCRLV